MGDASSRHVVLGVDVGGTFTDIVALDETDGSVVVDKVSSTRGDEAAGFVAAVGRVAPELGAVAALIHGTTVGTNALLERKGARTAVIATEGFADVIEMRRRDRPATWGLWGDFEPVSPRDLRIGVEERVTADGDVLVSLDPDEVVKVARELLARGAEAVAVTFLHSYANTDNEDRAAAALRAMWPNDAVSVSSEILAEIREFERSSTTVLNAYLQPVVGSYLEKLDAELSRSGFDGDFLIVSSNGGVMTVDDARRFPVRTALSGPAAGVTAAAAIARAAGHEDVLTGDVGGTSFDLAVVAGGQPVESAQTTIDFGLTIRSPMVEISTIGAGGGSIAWVDRAGLLRIGPQSAGSVPGPVCYGQGNDRPTVTDANVVLGRINPHHPIGGREALDVDAARAAIRSEVAEPLGLTIENAAEAILVVASSRMAGALRVVSIERGHDPGGFRLVPFGGGGGLNCCDLVAEVGLAGALVPRHPGVVSALGCVMADLRHDMVRTLNTTVVSADMADVAAQLTRAADDGRRRLAASGVSLDAVVVHHEADMSYVGQSHTVAVPLVDRSGADLDPSTLDRAAVESAFARTYTEQYGRTLEGIEVLLMNLRTVVVGRRPRIDLVGLGSGAAVTDIPPSQRPVYFRGRWHDAAIVERSTLVAGDRLSGPAVVEQADATTVLPPGWTAEVDRLGNLDITGEDRHG